MNRWPEEYVPLNGCAVCGIDFASVDAFDAHLGGTAETRVHLDPYLLDLEERPSRGHGVALFGIEVTEEKRASLEALAATRR